MVEGSLPATKRTSGHWPFILVFMLASKIIANAHSGTSPFFVLFLVSLFLLYFGQAASAIRLHALLSP